MDLCYLIFLGQLYWTIWKFYSSITVTSSASKEQREILFLSQMCLHTFKATGSSSAKKAIRQPLKSNQEYFSLWGNKEYF